MAIENQNTNTFLKFWDAGHLISKSQRIIFRSFSTSKKLKGKSHLEIWDMKSQNSYLLSSQGYRELKYESIKFLVLQF